MADAALAGVVYFIVAHAFAKAAMFLAAGTLQRAAGSDRLADLRSTAAALPISVFAFALAGASIMGLPPSGGFIAKWTLLTAALNAGHTLLVAMIVVGGLLSAAYVFRVLALPFGAGAESGEEAAPAASRSAAAIPQAMRWAPLALALVAVLLGLSGLPVMETLGGSSIDSSPSKDSS